MREKRSGLDGAETVVNLGDRAAALLGLLRELEPNAVKSGFETLLFSKRDFEATLNGDLGGIDTQRRLVQF